MEAIKFYRWLQKINSKHLHDSDALLRAFDKVNENIVKLPKPLVL